MKENEELSMSNQETNNKPKIDLPSVEAIQRELSSAKSIDDFFGREGIFVRLFSKTLRQMLEAKTTCPYPDPLTAEVAIPAPLPGHHHERQSIAHNDSSSL